GLINLYFLLIIHNVWRICSVEKGLEMKIKFSQSFMIWGCMSDKGPGQMAIITSSVNAQVHSEILDTFLIPSIKHRFGGDIGIFQDDNESCHRAKSGKGLLQKRYINSITWENLSMTRAHPAKLIFQLLFENDRTTVA
uniref:Tc1-like transposase DDE domain-containing protein n=1 Tax=Paramormyrops kingsleyae TaxID=1676925 RepID=A0A3B3RF17_9TELE